MCTIASPSLPLRCTTASEHPWHRHHRAAAQNGREHVAGDATDVVQGHLCRARIKRESRDKNALPVAASGTAADACRGGSVVAAAHGCSTHRRARAGTRRRCRWPPRRDPRGCAARASWCRWSRTSEHEARTTSRCAAPSVELSCRQAGRRTVSIIAACMHACMHVLRCSSRSLPWHADLTRHLHHHRDCRRDWVRRMDGRR